MSTFDIRNDDYFPTFSDLPIEGVLNIRYYEDPYKTIRKILDPIKHWCLLVEIVTIVPYLRPMWTVKDKSGRVFPLVFYLKEGVEVPKNFLKHAKPGKTISVMYAEQHNFADGQCGLRIEDVTSGMAYPCDLQTFSGLSDQTSAVSEKCQTCDSDASQHCSACRTVKYCREECQRQHWDEGHKRECHALRQLNDWKGRNWGTFDKYWDYVA